MNIESPYFLVLVLFVPFLWFLANKYKQYRHQSLSLFGSSITHQDEGGLVPSHFWMFLLGLLLLGISATNPRLKGQPVKVTKKGGDVIFALDVSKSMLAQDVKPNRLERAKLVCLDALQGFDNQRVAVVVFAGSAYVTMPFSTNYSAVAAFIDEANPGQVSAQGSDYVNLVETLLEFFGKDEQVERGVVVLSDGEDHSKLSTADVKKANEAGLIFLTVGVGTTKGTPIPDGRSYLQDRSGKKVMTKLHKKSLKKLAGSKGAYFSLSQRGALLRAIRKLRESNFSDMQSYEYQSLFQFFLFPGILLLIFSFWRSGLSTKKVMNASVILLLLFVGSHETLAQKSHENLLKGDKAYKKEKYADAAAWYGKVTAEESENTQALYNYGVAQAKAGEQNKALSAFEVAASLADNQHDKASSLYNQGTLLLSKKDQLDNSIKRLKEALRISPNDMDIRKNLAKATQLKRSQLRKQQQQKQQQQKKQDQQNQDNKDQKDQQNKDQQNEQKQDQKDQKDQQKQDQKDQQKKDQQDQKDQKNQQDKDQKDQQKQDQKDQQKDQSDQSKDQQNFDDSHDKTPLQKPMSIKKQKALQQLKKIDAEERKVRRKLQRMKGKTTRSSGKNW